MTRKKAKTARKAPPGPGLSAAVLPRLRDGIFIALLGLAVYLALALASYDPRDPGWSYTGSAEEAANLVGAAGAWVADVLLFFFGFLSYLFPLLLVHQAWLVVKGGRAAAESAWPLFWFRMLGLFLALLAGSAIAAMHFQGLGEGLRQGSGGVLGAQLAALLEPALSYIGASLLLVSLLLIGLTAALDISWLLAMEATGRLVWLLVDSAAALWQRLAAGFWEQLSARRSTRQRRAQLQRHVERRQQRGAPIIAEPRQRPAGESRRVNRERQGNLFAIGSVDSLPALHLLDASSQGERQGYSAQDLEAMSRLLELKLKDYGIEAEVVAVFPGPVITRFEIQPAPGVKVSRITGLAKDLARSLAVVSVRVVEVVPGKSVVGIEIPNASRVIVRIGEVLKSRAYDESGSPLSLALGHDIAGEPVVEDLTRMPHLLVAGTTGSGKSVGLNAMILSVLFKSSPEAVRMIMVDPKMLELAVYEGIPHLLTPVVTDMKDAANALRWCVAEMERRYRLMAALGVRNLAGFNRKVRDASKAGRPLADPLWTAAGAAAGAEAEEPAPALETLPCILVIIDEFADMMMIVGKKVEELIARIAQKARAAGIHLILATQRPSVDVITGLIKANIPARIAYQVSSRVDSRTIMDQGGAEQLLGHGDMLYLPPGTSLPMRVHGAFVDDDEVHRVVKSWKALGQPSYLDAILEGASEAEMLPGLAAGQGGEADGEADPLYDEAVKFVTESKRASISSVQRKLRIGYNRAARIIEMMEAAGLVSEMNANGTRELVAHAPPE